MRDPIEKLIYRLSPKYRPIPVLIGGIVLHLSMGIAYSFGYRIFIYPFLLKVNITKLIFCR